MITLRVGLLLPTETIPAWVARLIERLQAQPETELAAALILPQPALHNPFFRAHFELDRILFRVKPSPWTLSTLPPDLPLLRGDTLAHLQALRLDVLLNLCLDRIPSEMLPLVRFGVWSVRDVRVGIQPGWLQVWNGDPITPCHLEVQRPGQPPCIVDKSLMASDLQSLSRNQMHLLWRSAALIPRALRRLSTRGEADFFSVTTRLPCLLPASLPNPLQLAALGIMQAVRWLRIKAPKLYSYGQWALMLAPRDSDAPLTWEGFTPLQPPRDRLWADPFLVEREGRRYIFMEEMRYAARRGSIACLTLDENNRIGSKATVLERPYHLSYPFVFEYGGQWYMLPETSGNRTIELYRCTHFPDQWIFEKTLMRDLLTVDTTLVEYEGRWWLFTGLAGDENHNTWDSLHLFYADSPLSETWTPHPLNPVVADVCSARPAGRPFRRGGTLMRPAQNSSRRYGGALHLQRIDKLSMTEYGETCVETLDPLQRGLLASHTINFAGDLTVIDVQVLRSKIVKKWQSPAW
ncbi:MAG: hypothetical protein HY869_18100 [Chloroflexi bacterium]|nr:hypothetical protein [Chloroflexota bacterium]